MNRRYWPAALALLSVAIFGSYLLYTEQLVRRIRREAEIQRRMYAEVQRGILSNDASGATQALLELQEEIRRLGVPILVLDAAGEPTAFSNIPFDVDLSDPADRIELKRFAATLERENGFITERGVGEIYFGAPPILQGLRWIPWLQVSGGVLALLVALALIRANMRAERERLWTAMARELAHQMGTPLSSMTGWLEILQLPPSARGDMGDDVEIARELGADVQRLERVSRRFELIGKPPRLAASDVASIMSDLDEYLRPRLPRLGSGVDFSVRVEPGLPYVRANRVLLLWALENLVKNALDALAGRGGRIHVAALQGPRGGVTLAVTDNGPGIDRSVRDRLFDPGVSTKRTGWGVGLSLARRIVEDLHGGRISVRVRKGGGTIFQIDLPAAGKVQDGSGEA